MLELEKILRQIAPMYIKELKDLLLLENKQATGQLIRTLDYILVKSPLGEKDINKVDNIKIELYAEDYLIFVDKGRKAGGKMPPLTDKSNIQRGILPWVKTKNINFIDKKTKKPIGHKSTAFLIARSIKNNGIKPTNVIERAYKNIADTIERMIIDGASSDLIELFENIANNLNSNRREI